MTSRLIGACLFVLGGYCGNVLSGEPSTYDKALAALKSADCKTAVLLLNQYKAESTELLKKNPGFASQIDAQIKACGTYPSMIDHGIQMFGYGRPLPREIRLEIFHG